ncbi:hypothetical protein D3C86_1402670 [compost metagenome]
MSKKQYKANFLNFIGIKEEPFCVVRINSSKECIQKDLTKGREFPTLPEAVAYFESIKNEKIKNTEVMTAIFKGGSILKKYQKISYFTQKQQTKLSL